MINGLMMDYPLTLQVILHRAKQFYAEKSIISKLADSSLHRYSYAEFSDRVLQLINVLKKLGVQPGDRVATFAWNGFRHLELYFAVPCMGAVLHTVNIRLFPEQLEFVINHAEDKLIFVDHSLTKLLVPLQNKFNTVQNYILMNDGVPAQEGLNNSLDYETLLAQVSAQVELPTLDENTAAALCYTTGTTDTPKGVLYSHRALFLHSLGAGMVDSLGLSEKEVVMPVVPMFHVNAWGVPYGSALVGTDLVLPGCHLTGASLADLIEQLKVTIALGVPTIWKLLYQHLKYQKRDLSSLRKMVIGGSAAPQSMIEAFQRDFNIPILHAWGMTELSPVGTVCNLKSVMATWDAEKQFKQRAKQGLPVPGIEIRVEDNEGKLLPWDGESVGELVVRGPWVAKSYYKSEASSNFTPDGWFRTGDVVRVDAHGYVEITDRKKDLIKSRGEWISSVDMENVIMACPGIFEATVVGKPDAIREEVPAVFIVLAPTEKDKPSADRLNAQGVLDFLAKNFARWQLPKLSDIYFIDVIPKTSVGKFDKKSLRERVSKRENNS